MKLNELLEPEWNVAAARKPWPLNSSSLLSVSWPHQGHIKFSYGFLSIHHVNQKLVPEAHYSQNRILIFNLNLFLSSLHIFCVSLSCNLCDSSTSTLVLFPSDTILLHLPTPSFIPSFCEKITCNSFPHHSLHFGKMSKSCSLNAACEANLSHFPVHARKFSLLLLQFLLFFFLCEDS